MRSHAKASSAGSSLRQGTTPGGIFRGAFATRGFSSDVNGSSAPSRRSAQFASGLLVIAIAILALAPSASAVFTRARTDTFGPAGSGAGQLAGNTGIAVDQGTHAIYVADTGNHRVVKFDSTGAFVSTWGWGVSDGSSAAQICASGCQAGISGSAAGQFNSPRFIAVDNSGGASAHDVYVGDTATGIVQKFDSSGTLIAAWGGSPAGGQQNGAAVPSGPFGPIAGVAVDSTGNLSVFNTDTRLYKFSEAGAFSTTFTTERGTAPNGLGVDPGGNFFKVNGSPSVEKFGPTGADIGQVDSAGNTVDLTIDPVDGDLYVVGGSRVDHYHFDGSGRVVLANASTCVVASFAGCGATDSFGTGGITSGAGVAIDHASDTVYVSDPSSGGDKVYAYGPAQNFSDATGTPNPAANISFKSAEISATIDDNNGLLTSWRLEYSSDGGSSWTIAKTGATAGNQSGAVVSASPSDLAVNTSYLFRVVTNKGSGASTEVTSSSLSFKTLNPPAATATPTAATNVTDTSASIAATITDNSAVPTNWRFELSSDGGVSWSTVGSGTTAGGASGAPISEALSGLIPNLAYKFRVATNKGPGSSDAFSSAFTFQTLPVPPTVSNVGAIQVTDTSARLVATINPKHSDTGYVFEYGTTPALGSSTAPLAIGAGATPLTLSQVVNGLAKDTTYYFRAVATNTSGSTPSTPQAKLHTRTTPPPTDPSSCPNEAIRRAQHSVLPDCRAYEMVTPVDKNFGDAHHGGIWGPKARLSADGNAVASCISVIFNDPPGQLGKANCGDYLSHRGASGWQTISPLPRYCHYDPVSGEAGSSSAAWMFLDHNFEHSVVSRPEPASCSLPPLDPAAPVSFGEEENNYLQDLHGDPAAPASFQLLNPEASIVEGGVVGGDDDFSHVLYESRSNQTAPPDSPPAGDFLKLYDWSEGNLSLVSKDTNNVPFETSSGIARLEGDFGTNPDSAISADGRRVYFQNVVVPVGLFEANGERGACVRTFMSNCELYLREDGAITYKVSASECTVSCGTVESPAMFQWASEDGNTAIFGSCAKLTNASDPGIACQGPLGAGDALVGKLYRWDRNSAPGSRLVDMTIDHEPADGVKAIAAVIGASDDGNVVYFGASGQLVAGAPFPPLGIPRELIYRWRWNNGSPTLDYLGILEGPGGNGERENSLVGRTDHVTPDGKYLLISTKAPLDPVADTDVSNSFATTQDTTRDFYRWSEKEGWLCITCQRPGDPSVGDAFGVDRNGSEEVGLQYKLYVNPLVTQQPGVIMSDDGQKIFFETANALVTEDVNGEVSCKVPGGTLDPEGYPRSKLSCTDVYEWNDGRISLISLGTGSGPSILGGFDSTGKNVIFFTRDRLVGSDVDDSVDIYDARVNGGFPEPPPQPPGCEGESCRGQGTSPANTPGAGTAAFEGPGNPNENAARKPSRCGRGLVKRHGRCVKHRKHRTANRNRRISG